MKLSLKNLKIQRQLILLACLPVIVLGTVLGYYFIDSRVKDLEKYLHDRGQTVARQSASALEYGVLIENFSVIAEVVDSIFKETEISAVFVKNQYDHILHSRSSQAVPIRDNGNSGWNFGKNAQSDDILIFSAPIVQKIIDIEDFESPAQSPQELEPDIVGTVEIYIDKKPTIDQQNIVIRNGVLITLICLLGMIGLAYYTGRKIALPIVKLTSSVNKIARGELDQRLDETSTAEIGQLEKGFNNMAAAIKASRSQLEKEIHEVTNSFNLANQALKDSESKYRDLFENASDVVVTFNTNGELISTNNAFSEEIYDTKTDSQMPQWSEIVAPSSRLRALRINKKHMTSDERLTYELDLITKNNVIKTFEISSRSITKNQNVIGIHAIARDITKRIEFQQALVDARKAAETANRAKSGFLANMSHEIRTPVSGIIGFLDLLAESKLTEEQIKLFKPVMQSSNQLVAIVNDILDFAKIEAQQVDLQQKPFEFYSNLRQSVELLMPMASQKKIDLRYKFDQLASCHVQGDAVRVGQIITNLVANAIKFTDQGYVCMDVHHDDLPNNKVKINVAVQDTGIGISEEEIAHLFDPFWQASDSPNRRFGGSGLGLAIAYHFVELMQGTIQVESKKGEGSLFKLGLTFPKQKVEHKKNRHESERLSLELLAPISILVIDDNTIVREYFKAMLAGMEIKNEQASNRNAALRACESQQFDIVFLDLHMPDIDGIQTFDDIRNNEKIYQPKIIIALTADAIVGNKENTIAHGFDDFVAKPITKSQFIQIVHHWFPEKVSISGGPSKSPQSVPSSKVVLDAKAGIKIAGDNAKLWETGVQRLLDDLPEYIEMFDKSYSLKNSSQLYEKAHKLAGTSSYLGALDLQENSRNLMKILKSEGSRPNKINAINKLRESLHQFQVQASQALQKVNIHKN